MESLFVLESTTDFHVTSGSRMRFTCQTIVVKVVWFDNHVTTHSPEYESVLTKNALFEWKAFANAILPVALDEH